MGINEFFADINWQNVLLRLALTVVAVMVVWIARRFTTRFLMPPLRRLTKHNDFEADDILVNALQLPLNLVFLALAIFLTATIILPSGESEFFLHLTRSLIIIAAFALLYQTVGLLTSSVPIVANLTGLRVDEQLLPFMRTGLRIIIAAIAIVIVLQEWQYDVGGLIAGLGLGGLAFALAAESTIANLFGFTTIVGDRPLVVGEFIITPDVTGIVEKVGFRSTRVRQLDQAVVTIPNSTLADSVITNWSRLHKRWLNMTIGLTYNTTSAQMREFIKRVKAMLSEHEHVDPDSVTVLFTGFGDSALEVLLRAYFAIAPWGDFMQKQQEVMLDLMDIVDDLGLGFAFPSTSLYVEQLPRPDDASAPLPGITPVPTGRAAAAPPPAEEQGPPDAHETNADQEFDYLDGDEDR